MISRFRLQLFILGGLLLSLGSCVTQSKLPYLQTGAYSTQKPLEAENARPVYKLQSGDVLSIRVQSVQPVLSDIFNVPGPQTITSSDPGTLYLTGYAVETRAALTCPPWAASSCRASAWRKLSLFCSKK